jgi:outer membrane lipoprotein LolB
MIRCLFLILIVLLSACTVRQPVPTEWEAQRTLVQSTTDWNFNGRMAIKSDTDEQVGGQVSVRWQQEGDVSQIRLSGPLGAGAWELLWTPERVQVGDSSGERSIQYTGPSAAEDFMQAELGWAFPAQSIRYWVRGLAAPEAPSQASYAEDGQLLELVQHGWTISFQRYAEFDDIYMPVKIAMSGRGVRLRIVITRWDLSADIG